MIPGETARNVELVVLDADGVLTDGGIYVADGVGGEPFQLRRFHVRDGMAVHLLRQAGIEPVVVSGRDSPAVRDRARELRIDEVHQVTPWNKVPVIEGILDERALSWSRTACLADDLADIAVMEEVALPACVADAVPEIRSRADWIGQRPGGRAAVREFTEELLTARRQWDDVVEAYLERARGGSGPA